MIISIPSVVIISALLLSLYGGSIRFTVPVLFALAFLPMFGIGGLTGLPLGLAATDIPLHDTYYVIGHFHYVVAPGTLFALFAGIYYWFPKVTGRRMNDRLGRVHFWGSLIAMNGIFLPMFIQGLAGLNRRLYDGGRRYSASRDSQGSCAGQAWSAVLLGAVQIVFIGNFFWSLTKGATSRREPLACHNARVGNEFAASARQLPLTAGCVSWALRLQPGRRRGLRTADAAMIPYTVDRRPDTGVTNVTMGVWLFLASEVMLFGALFSAYAMLRAAAPSWPDPRAGLDVRDRSHPHGAPVAGDRVPLARPRDRSHRSAWLIAASGLAALFLFAKFEYSGESVEDSDRRTARFSRCTSRSRVSTRPTWLPGWSRISGRGPAPRA